MVQGSTLGPVLFLIYINNISKIQTNGKLTLFADDTLIFVTGATWEEVKNKAEFDLYTLKKWLDQNVLSLNVTKTKFMPISLRKLNEYKLENLTIHVCGSHRNNSCLCSKIEKVDSYK